MERGRLPCKIYTLQEVENATNNFAKELGSGGFGSVYEGTLDGVRVAVKRISPTLLREFGGDGGGTFQRELEVLGSLHHPHLLPLMGSCPQEGILVYELMEGGNLQGRIDRAAGGEQPPLPWTDRVRIIYETSLALLHLHTSNPPIVHRDIKPANVLLDRSNRARLGDAGIAAVLPEDHNPIASVQSSNIIGSTLYLDPEYMRTGRYGPKSDVYSLGVTMLQVLTGRGERSVVGDVDEALEESSGAAGESASFDRLVDASAGCWPREQALEYAQLANRCCQLARNSRPALAEVVEALGKLAAQAAEASAGAAAAAAAAAAATQQAAAAAVAAGSVPPGLDIEEMFICPIMQELMTDPVVAADGHTYERSAIEAWLTSKDTSPLTRETLATKALVPNLMVRSAIREWRDRRHAAGLVGTPRAGSSALPPPPRPAPAAGPAVPSVPWAVGEMSAPAREALAGLRSGDAARMLQAAEKVCEMAAASVAAARAVGEEPGVLDALGSVLSLPGVGDKAAAALSKIGEGGDSVRAAIARVPGMMAGLLAALERPAGRAAAAGAIGEIARGGAGLRQLVVETPAVLPKLVSGMQTGTANSAWALLQLARGREPSVLQQLAEAQGMLPALAAALALDEERACAAGLLGELAPSSPDLPQRIVDTPNVLSALVAVVQYGEKYPAWAVNRLLRSHKEGVIKKLANTPGLLAAMVAALGHMASRYDAAGVLGVLAGSDAAVPQRLVDIPGALSALVAAVQASDNNAAWTLNQIARCRKPEVLQKLTHATGLLAAAVTALGQPGMRDDAAGLLGEIAGSGAEAAQEVAAANSVILALVATLRAGSDESASALNQLARSRKPDVLQKLASTPGLITAMVAALGQPGTRYNAAGVLGEIAHSWPDGVEQLVNTPGTVEALAAALPSEKIAGWALYQLSKSGKEGVIQKLADAPGVIPALVAGLGRQDTQSNAAGVLGDIAAAGPDVPQRIVDATGALSSLVAALQGGCKNAAWALNQLARSRTFVVLKKMADAPGLLAAAVGALGQPDMQYDAAGLLGEIAVNVPSSQPLIWDTPGALAALAASLEGGNTCAAWVLSLLVTNSRAPADMPSRLADTPGMFAALAVGLTKEGARDNAAFVLGHIAKGGRNLRERIISATSLIAAVVAAIQAGGNDALSALATIAIAPAEEEGVARALVEQPGLLTALVASMAPLDFHATLACIAYERLCRARSAALLLKMADAPGALGALIMFLGKEITQQHTACALGNLAACGTSLRRRIMSTPGAPKALAAAAAAGLDAAVITISKLVASGEADVVRQMADADGLFPALLRALGRPVTVVAAVKALNHIMAVDSAVPDKVATAMAALLPV